MSGARESDPEAVGEAYRERRKDRAQLGILLSVGGMMVDQGVVREWAGLFGKALPWMGKEDDD